MVGDFAGVLVGRQVGGIVCISNTNVATMMCIYAGKVYT